MIYVAAVIGVLLLLVVLAPFFVGPGGLLQGASSINSPAKLEALKEAILERYLSDQKAFESGSISKLAWDKRQAFLVNRYIDTARRLDYVEGLRRVAAGSESPSSRQPEGSQL